MNLLNLGIVAVIAFAIGRWVERRRHQRLRAEIETLKDKADTLKNAVNQQTQTKGKP
jgi:hypothetical protein